MLVSKLSRPLLACNIYVSAGGKPNHRDLLLDLLRETQELCRLANTKNVDINRQRKAAVHRVVVVHAFRDGPYDRSSFHLAGSPDLVAGVGSSLAVLAVQALQRLESTKATATAVGNGTDNSEDPDFIETNENESTRTRHPTVGLVDHVSVLPLDENDPNGEKEMTTIAGSVARNIGETLRSSGSEVFYYGHAHPSGKELAVVRRNSTRFFEDNTTAVGGTESGSNGGIPKVAAGQATVGAPSRFVENFNIRLKPGVSRKVARTLTECIRERSGRGLAFVEALTLAYGSDQYEVACNLLDTSVTSSMDVEERTREWEQQQLLQRDDDAHGLVETAYRVGTTTDMCLKALREVSTGEGETAYNKEVFERLEKYFLE